jgi:hypothetical protein
MCQGENRRSTSGRVKRKELDGRGGMGGRRKGMKREEQSEKRWNEGGHITKEGKRIRGKEGKRRKRQAKIENRRGRKEIGVKGGRKWISKRIGEEEREERKGEERKKT